MTTAPRPKEPDMTDRDLRAADEHNEGLLSKYHVERRNDPEGKHNECRYFVLDPQHDPIARDALRAYATAAGAEGYFALRADLHRWLDRIEANKQLQDLEVRVAYEEAKARRAEPPSGGERREAGETALKGALDRDTWNQLGWRGQSALIALLAAHPAPDRAECGCLHPKVAGCDHDDGSDR